jgi:hypothetical protein
VAAGIPWEAYAAWRQAAGVELLPADLTALGAEIALAHQALGGAAAAAWDTGQMLTLKQTAAYALGTDPRYRFPVSGDRTAPSRPCRSEPQSGGFIQLTAGHSILAALVD